MVFVIKQNNLSKTLNLDRLQFVQLLTGQPLPFRVHSKQQAGQDHCLKTFRFSDLLHPIILS